MHKKAIYLLCSAIFLLPLLATAQPYTEPTQEQIRQVVDEYMRPYLSGIHAPGAIVGVSLQGHRYFYAYGEAKDDGTPFTRDTLVEIGSCTKVFTTTLFALATDRKQIAPDGSIQQYMPNHIPLQPATQRVTPLELADFTSGMPDLPPNLPKNLEERSIRHYTTRDFLKWVSHWTPNSSLPAPYLYSNAGIGLLGYLVDTATGARWEDQLNQDVTKPLGMTDTALRTNGEQRERLAQGHHENGTDAPQWPIFAWYAAGGLRSTAADMLRFGEANLGHREVDGRPVPKELTTAMSLAQTPIYTLPNGTSKQAMAWVIEPGNTSEGANPVILKNGGTVGFGSVIILNHAKDLTVFIAVNQNQSKPAHIGVEIVRHIP
jgi:CubicO group peptidase (beta-lactamase class C family)